MRAGSGRVLLLGSGRVLLVALGWVLLAHAPRANAHALAPALLELRERPGGVVDVRFKTSVYASSGALRDVLRPVLPSGCEATGPAQTTLVGTGQVERWQIQCSGSLVGAVVGVAGLADNRIDALLRVELAGGHSMSRVLRGGAATVRIPEQQGRVDLVASYARMGGLHIFSGLDHLLFVFGLVLLVSGLRALLFTLSAFTLGHSITLCAAALGFVHVSGSAVELLIAGSVLVLAVRLARDPGVAIPSRSQIPMASAFGLLHGLGFAGALAQAGLPEVEIPLALASFNVGIELGQLAFVAAVVAIRGLVRGLALALPVWVARVPTYAMGSLAAFWCLERAARLFDLERAARLFD